MEPLGSFPRELNVLPREKIEGPTRDFQKADPRPHPRPDQRPKVRGAAGPEGFWPLFWPKREKQTNKPFTNGTLGSSVVNDVSSSRCKH